MTTKEISLRNDIAQLLTMELGDQGTVSCPDNHITLTISTNSFQRSYGNILQQIHRAINEYYPERHEHTFILIRDKEGTFKNVVKIWKSV